MIYKEDGTKTVAAKQVLVHDGHLFLIDAAGQLWYADVNEARYESPVNWTQIELPQS